MDQISISLANGCRLVAEKNDSEYKEIYIGVIDKSGFYKDLAIAGEAYTYEGDDVVPEHGNYFVKVYADPDNEDFTNEFNVRLPDDDLVDVAISIKAKVRRTELEEIKRLEHHAEGICEEYPELQNINVSVKTEEEE